jgi:hypothetical protein
MAAKKRKAKATAKAKVGYKAPARRAKIGRKAKLKAGRTRGRRR